MAKATRAQLERQLATVTADFDSYRGDVVKERRERKAELDSDAHQAVLLRMLLAEFTGTVHLPYSAPLDAKTINDDYDRLMESIRSDRKQLEAARTTLRFASSRLREARAHIHFCERLVGVYNEDVAQNSGRLNVQVARLFRAVDKDVADADNFVHPETLHDRGAVLFPEIDRQRTPVPAPVAVKR